MGQGTSAPDPGIIPALGALRLDQVTPNKINAFLGSTGKSASTVRSIAALLSSLSRVAVEDERIKKSFMPNRLSLPRAKADERVFLDKDQVAALVQAATNRDKALIQTAAWTGLRWGELVASSGNVLTWTGALSKCERPWWTSAATYRWNRPKLSVPGAP